MWFFLALAATSFYSFRRFSEKRLSENIEHFTLAFAVQAFSLPGIALLLFFAKIPNLFSLSLAFWIPLMIIWIVLYPSQAFFYYKSMKHGDITYVLPLMSFVPIFNAFTSWILLGELPSTIGFLGILSIVFGVYVLNLKANLSIFNPFFHLFRDKPSLFMIINCFFLAFGSTLDKIAIHASNPLFYSFINTLGASIILFAFAWLANKKFSSHVQKNRKSLFFVGILQAFGFSSYLLALNTGVASYVNAIKSANVLLGSIWGFFFLKEKVNKQKIISFFLILFGLVLIALG